MPEGVSKRGATGVLFKIDPTRTGNDPMMSFLFVNLLLLIGMADWRVFKWLSFLVAGRSIVVTPALWPRPRSLCKSVMLDHGKGCIVYYSRVSWLAFHAL